MGDGPGASQPPWREIGFPVPPPTIPASLETVAEATLTVFVQGALAVAPRQRPDRFVTGAVYDADGRLVPRSQRVGGLSNDHALSIDPPELPPSDGPVTRLTGTWLYGGTWFNHFGHFLTETLTTLWPREPVDGVVFHPFWFGSDVLPYQLEALQLLGIPTQPVVVGAERVVVERLLVPTRAYLPNGYAAPEALQVYDRLRRSTTWWRGWASTSSPPRGSASPIRSCSPPGPRPWLGRAARVCTSASSPDRRHG